MKKLALISILAVCTLLLCSCVDSGGDEQSGKTVLKLATGHSPSTDIMDLVLSYNDANEDIHIDVVTYTLDDLDRLHTEMLAEDGPDIFAFHGATISPINIPTYYENLLPYLEQDQQYSKEIFVPSLLNAMIKDDYLFGLPYDFDVSSFIAPTSIVGDRTSITMEEAERFATENEMDVFPNYMDKSVLTSQVLYFSYSNFVDYDARTCSFDSPEFIALIEACNNQSDDNTEEGESLLTRISFSDDFAMLSNLKTIYGDDYTYVGFPNESSNGSDFSINSLLGISVHSKNKQAAWDFIRLSMEKENHSKEIGKFSAAQETFNETIQDNISNEVITKTDEERFIDLLENTTLVSMPDIGVVDIVLDEIDTFFAGQTTAEECAELIDSRVSQYLSAVE